MRFLLHCIPMNNTNDRATDDILKKVKKLMALGSSPSEAEAASALEKARLLLAKHGLSLADVEAHQPEIVEGVLLEKKRLRTWEHYLVGVVSRCTFTQALTVQRGDIRQILIIGRQINTLAASELFVYLHKVILILARAHSGSVVHLDSFRIGVVVRIGERLDALGEDTAKEGGPWAGNADEDDSTAEGEDRTLNSARKIERHGTKPTTDAGTLSHDRQLTVQMTATANRENKSFIEDKYGRTKTKSVGRRVHGDSYDRGLKAGDGVSLNRQIKG